MKPKHELPFLVGTDGEALFPIEAQKTPIWMQASCYFVVVGVILFIVVGRFAYQEFVSSPKWFDNCCIREFPFEAAPCTEWTIKPVVRNANSQPMYLKIDFEQEADLLVGFISKPNDLTWGIKVHPAQPQVVQVHLLDAEQQPRADPVTVRLNPYSCGVEVGYR